MERLIQQELEPFFKKNGYSFFYEYHNCFFRKINNEWAEQFEIQSTSAGLGYIEHMICFFEVEKELLLVESSNANDQQHLFKKLRSHKILIRSIDNKLLSSQLAFNYQKPASTEEEIRFLAKNIIEYMNGGWW